MIAYANSLKTGILGVPEEVLKKYGAVSKQTAHEMAAGVRRLCGADIGLAITGIAGPGGGSDEKPKGLVYIHLNAENADREMRQLFSGSRETVKMRAITQALTLLWKYLKETHSEEVNG